MTSGIYKIYFFETPNKVYVGSSKSCELRHKQHLRKLRAKKHINPHLQYAFDKYGENSLSFEIIELAGLEHLIDRELYWYEKFLNSGILSYNVIVPDKTPTNSGRTWLKKGNIPWNKGSKVPKIKITKEELSLKLSEAHKGQIPWFKNTGDAPPTNTGRTRFKNGDKPEWLTNKTPENLEKKRLAGIKCSETIRRKKLYLLSQTILDSQ